MYVTGIVNFKQSELVQSNSMRRLQSNEGKLLDIFYLFRFIFV